MKKLFTLLTLGVLLVAYSGLQANVRSVSKAGSELTTSIREISDFKYIVFEGQGNLFIKQGDTYKVELETVPHLHDLIFTEVEDNMLIIKLNEDTEVDQLNISITLPVLEGIIFDGQGNIFSEGRIESQKLNMKIDGSGMIKMDIKVAELISVVNGSGDIYLMGSADVAKCEINGTGDLQFEDLRLTNADIVINGSGKARVSVDNKLSVLINGVGNVEYLGEPELISQFIKGSGELISLE